jgi:hypothetical protein
MDQQPENEGELDFEREWSKGKSVLPPLIIKGGSIAVQFPGEGYVDDEHGTKVKSVTNPEDARIATIEIRDYNKNLLNSYTLPASLNGKCFVLVWDEAS